MPTLEPWLFWALLSAVFAALTAIFAKIGLRGIDADFAQLVRTAVVLVAMTLLVTLAGKWQPLSSINVRAWWFLILSGLATGASWLCYFRALSFGDASRVAPVDKLSVVLVAIFAATVLQERLSPLGWLGIALVGAGVVLVAMAR